MRNEFLNKLQKDVENIRPSKNMLVFADKSTNIYEVSREHYEKLLHDGITQTYKRATPGTKRKIDKESKQFAEHLGTICRTSRNLQNISEFAEHLGIADRMECYSDHHAFITLNTIKTTLKITPRADS